MNLVSLHVLVFISLLILIFYINWKGYFSWKRPFYYGPFTPLVYTYLLMIVVFVSVYFFGSWQKEQRLTHLETMLTYAQENNDMDRQMAYFDTIIAIDSQEVMYWVQKWLVLQKNSKDQSLEPLSKAYRQEIEDLAIDKDSCRSALGHRILNQLATYHNHKITALGHLKETVKCFKQDDYINLSKAYNELRMEEESLEALRMEIAANGNKKGAYRLLLSKYIAKQDTAGIASVLTSFDGIIHTDPQFQRQHWWKKSNVKAYLIALLFTPINNSNWPVVLVSFCIVVLLAFYFIMLDIYNREPIWQLITAGLIGALLTPFVLVLYDYNEMVLHIGLGNGFIEKIKYTIFINALSEEILKSITLLAALYLFKNITEPLDYVIYAAMGALGFAFTENIIYFTHYGTNLIVPRAMFSTLGHITDSALLAYTMAFFRFKLHKSQILAYFLGLLFAVTAHSIFNLLAGSGPLMVLYFFVCTAILGGIINNCMNNSRYFDHSIVLSNDLLVSYIISVYLLLYMVQFGLNYHQNGSINALKDFKTNFLYTVFVIVAITRFLTSFDIVKGQWRNLFNYLIYRHRNLNGLIGLRLYFETDKLKDISYNGLLEGIVTDRVVVEKDERFLLVNLTQAITYQSIEYSQVVVKTLKENQILSPGARYPVYFVLPKNGQEVNTWQSNNKIDFEFIGYAIARCPEHDLSAEMTLVN